MEKVLSCNYLVSQCQIDCHLNLLTLAGGFPQAPAAVSALFIEGNQILFAFSKLE